MTNRLRQCSMLWKTLREVAMATPICVAIIGFPGSELRAQNQDFVTYDYRVLHTFKNPPDAALSDARLLRDGTGSFYGATEGGGVFGYGAVYRLDGRKVTVLHSFRLGANGTSPLGDLMRDEAGNLYGTAVVGGLFNYGVAFRLDRFGKLVVLHTFTGGKDGGEPYAGLIRDSNGNFEGTTWIGGDLSCGNNGFKGCGVVFKLNAKGGFTVLHRFTGAPDGAYPSSGSLVRDAEGNLYGTTGGGGPSNRGTIYKIDKDGKVTVLYSFTGGADGESPQAGLTLDDFGNLYGTAYDDHLGHGYGTVFELSRRGKFTVLYTFHGGSDGAYPHAGVIRDKRGNLYGTTREGGTGPCYIWNYQIGCGTVFKLDKNRKETVLHSFGGGDDGVDPIGGLTFDPAGSLYGTTAEAGRYNFGTIFELRAP